MSAKGLFLCFDHISTRVLGTQKIFLPKISQILCTLIFEITPWVGNASLKNFFHKYRFYEEPVFFFFLANKVIFIFYFLVFFFDQRKKVSSRHMQDRNVAFFSKKVDFSIFLGLPRSKNDDFSISQTCEGQKSAKNEKF